MVGLPIKQGLEVEPDMLGKSHPTHPDETPVGWMTYPSKLGSMSLIG